MGTNTSAVHFGMPVAQYVYRPAARHVRARRHDLQPRLLKRSHTLSPTWTSSLPITTQFLISQLHPLLSSYASELLDV